MESCGLRFEGRAHSGLIDSQNTAKIAIQMMQQGFCFTRTTRGFGVDGVAFGAKRRRVVAAAGGITTGITGGSESSHAVPRLQGDAQRNHERMRRPGP